MIDVERLTRYHNAIVIAGTLNRDHVFQDIAEYQRRVAIERISKAAATVGDRRKHIAGLQDQARLGGQDLLVASYLMPISRNDPMPAARHARTSNPHRRSRAGITAHEAKRVRVIGARRCDANSDLLCSVWRDRVIG